jgi:pyruvate, water dikinase
MMDGDARVIRSGFPSLDEILQGIRLGDNVVWQITELLDYKHFATAFAQQAIADKRELIYIRFATHVPILEPQDGLEIIEVDPGPGFDHFSSEVHRIIEGKGLLCFYVFDNLSALVEEWATDELLANFFQVTCPFLFELDTVAFFALTLGSHGDSTVVRIRDTTQILINLFRVKEKQYLHPLKVWDRYSMQMFLPHAIVDNQIVPIFQSGDAAEISSFAREFPLRAGADTSAPWESVYQKLHQYAINGETEANARPEFITLKQELIRMLIGSQPEVFALAETYLTAEDLFRIRHRVIGSGQIGGKAVGMLLARGVLLHSSSNDEFKDVLEDHDSFYIGADVFFTFLVNNNLFRMRLRLTRGGSITEEEFADVEQRFLEGTFSPDIMDQFRNMLDYFGQAPIIVRSSSLLEDSFGNAFAGKYRSEFCANQGSPEARLHAFLEAVKLVYASSLNPDALSYRHKRGLDERDEQMALLVQRVSGVPYKNYFFPSLAGVAFSHNLYVWTDRIDPHKGLIRLVFGLGTRAVDRVDRDYPRMIAISHPDLRPEVGAKVIKYSQREVDVLNLKTNEFETVYFSSIVEGGNYPNLHLFVSTMNDGYLTDPSSFMLDEDSENYVLTFNNLIRRTQIIKYFDRILETLEEAYNRPVDTEFTARLDSYGQVRINLLQCRPLGVQGAEGRMVTIPDDIDANDILFTSSRIVNGGLISDIRYIIFIDPCQYGRIKDPHLKTSLGRIIGKINAHPEIEQGQSILMGPGRWGSSNIDLGVNVRYVEINNISVLVEIAREEDGHVPEVSYGTHFFQDLVEDQILYLPVYPDDPKSQFKADLFDDSPNVLSQFLPDSDVYQDLIRIIDVPAISNGRLLQVVADPQTQEAVCFLKESDKASASEAESL